MEQQTHVDSIPVLVTRIKLPFCIEISEFMEYNFHGRSANEMIFRVDEFAGVNVHVVNCSTISMTLDSPCPTDIARMIIARDPIVT